MITPRPQLILCSGLFAQLLFAAMPVQAQSSVETLESSAFKLEVNTNPYSYRIVEKSTGETLLQESGGAWFTESKYPVRTASNVTNANHGLQAVLHLDGTSTPAQVNFRFFSPEILQVTLTFNSGIPTQISEEFTDQGEHYYGIWEMPFGASIDNRGADHDFLGIRHQPDVNYSSARAPFYATSHKYGIYVQTTGQGHYSVAQAGKTSFHFHDAQLIFVSVSSAAATAPPVGSVTVPPKVAFPICAVAGLGRTANPRANTNKKLSANLPDFVIITYLAVEFGKVLKPKTTLSMASYQRPESTMNGG